MSEKSSALPIYMPRRSSRRQSGLTPEKLRLKVLEAIPEWPTWPRSLRQVYVLLPTHGTGADGLGAICEALGWKAERLVELIARSGSFSKRLHDFTTYGHYPKVPRDKAPLPHSYLVEHFANEASVVALVALEITARESPGNLAKIVEGAGWFLNIQADTEIERGRQALRVGHEVEAYSKRLRRSVRRGARNKNNPQTPSGLVSFERGLDAEDAARELERVKQAYAQAPEDPALSDADPEPGNAA